MTAKCECEKKLVQQNVGEGKLEHPSVIGEKLVQSTTGIYRISFSAPPTHSILEIQGQCVHHDDTDT